MAENKTKSIIAILLAVSIIALSACDDVTTPKPAQSGSSAVSDSGDIEGGHGSGDYDDDDYVVEFENPSRLFYFTGITHDDMLRYTDDYLYSNVFLERWEVKQIYAQDDYLLVKDDIIAGRQYVHIYTESAITNANPKVGDTVTVYGQFVTTDQITWQSGASEIVPTVTAHRFYINNVAPRDIGDFAAGYVDFLNTVERSWPSGDRHQYLSDAKVKLLCSVENWDEWDRGWKVRPYGSVDGDKYFRSDGYPVLFDEFTNYEEMKDMINSFGVDDDMFWLTGNIVSIEGLDKYVYHIEFNVESVEPAGHFIGDYIPEAAPDDIDT